MSIAEAIISISKQGKDSSTDANRTSSASGIATDRIIHSARRMKKANGLITSDQVVNYLLLKIFNS